jgi:hypothetical protein
MKALSISFLCLFILCFAGGCQDDDQAQRPASGFDVDAQVYLTPKLYLILDDGPVFTNSFGFAVLNGEMREDNVNGASISAQTTHGGILWVENGPGTVSSEQAVSVNVGTHTLNDESLMFTNVLSFDDTYTFGGQTWGEPDIAPADMIEIGSLGNGTLTINAITIDYTTRTGTVDLTYNVSDGTRFTGGNYVGSFEIINEF